jgi:hypothetical protein
VMSASGNHMTHLSDNGVALFRRPPTGDDNDADANRFFWWSGFVADLFAPSEYLIIPGLCLVYGCISSIVVAAINAEGFSGFVSRVVNGSTLQNWVDIVTVFVCRNIIVRSDFLPVCGDATTVTVKNNAPVERGSIRREVLWRFSVAQLVFLVLYPIYYFMFPGLAYIMSSLNVLLLVVSVFGYLAAVLLLVRRSFDRTRIHSSSGLERAPTAGSLIETDHPQGPSWFARCAGSVSINVRFYAVIIRLFATCLVMMISCNFTLQVGFRMSTNAGLMTSGSGDFAKYYDPCLQYSGAPCSACIANGCSYCPTSRLCVSNSRQDSPCGGGEEMSYDCYAYSNSTCALYADAGPFCVGWSNCAYCNASGLCARTDESNCTVPVAVLTNHSFTSVAANTTDEWWRSLPYLSRDTVAYAQLLFYQLQISSGTCSAARVTQTAWTQANYITSLP